MKKYLTDNGWMKVKDVVSDVLSQPKRSIHDARRAVFDEKTRNLKIQREIKKSKISRNTY